MALAGSAMLGGSLSFDHRVQEWNIFKSRFTHYCEANDINKETDKAGVKRRALLLTALVEDTYRVVRDLLFPKVLEETEYVALLDILDKHFKGKKSTFGERLKFSMAQQRPGEEISEWAARVRNLVQHCGYKTDLVEVELRDRFVLGLLPSKEKEKLFAEDVDTLTFSKAVEIAQSVQCARLALQTGQSGPVSSGQLSAQPVFAVRAQLAAASTTGGAGASAGRTTRDSSRNNAGVTRCEVCGFRNHSKEKCRYIDYTCRKCKCKGHLMRMCKSGMRNQFFLDVDDSDTVQELFKNHQRQSSKLAGENQQHEEPLIPLEVREDSGIDSDEEEEESFEHPLMEVSDSEGDFGEEERWVLTEGMNGCQYLQQVGGNCKCNTANKEHRMKEMDFESDRNSPPLYEVELTASDEDDDASVLELVIPMQNSRYHRVPTTSPKKRQLVAPALLCNLFCCMRRTKK